LAGLESARSAPGHLPLCPADDKAHPSLCRSRRFWRDDIHWYGVGPPVDLSYGSRTLAYHLSGVSQGDDDLYVMVNAYWEPLSSSCRRGARAGGTVWWTPPERGRTTSASRTGGPLTSARYTVGPRSVVVLVRPRSL